MLEFRNIELNDIPIVKPYFQYATDRLCDFSVGGIFMWRETFDIRYAIQDGMLFTEQSYLDSGPLFSPPLGERPVEGYELLRRHCEERGVPLRLCLLSDVTRTRLPDIGNWEVRESVNWGDYLYPAEQMRTLGGRRLAGQRNHINYFTKTWPDYSVERITKENLPSVRALLERYKADTLKKSEMFYEEVSGDEEVLDHFDEYDFPGLCLKVDGVAVAFAMGEVVGDTLHVHIEKADRNFRGAYQMIVREFARAYAVGEVMYINREDDSGDEGLRTSKLSYHPCEILKKYTAVYKGDAERFC